MSQAALPQRHQECRHHQNPCQQDKSNPESVMKNKLHHSFIALALLALLTLNSQLSTARAQGTEFSYQGRLNTNGVAANGFFDFKFFLYTNAAGTGTQVGPTLTQTNIGVTNGLFTASLDFGAVFTGDDTWLAMSVRSNGVGSYTPLTPLQELLPTPYAVFANTASNLSGTVSATQLSGTVPLAHLPPGLVTNDESGVTFSNLTVSGSLSLPEPATAYSGGNPLLYADNQDNFFAGLNAGDISTSGSDNTALGSTSLQNNISGYYNTATGAQALQSNTNGNYNTATGVQALQNNTSGTINTATGDQALWYNATGIWNTATGVDALAFNTNGNYNTATGVDALSGNTSGSYNTAEGMSALAGNTTGSNNVALGYEAGQNLTGNSNIDIGHPGVSSDNMTIRIGNGQTQAYIAGVINGNGGGLTNLNASQLSTGTIPLAQLPATVVVENENGVTLDNMNIAGTLDLPFPATIEAGGASLLSANAGYNFFAGFYAGNTSLTGDFNTAVGDFSLENATTGAYNAAQGYYAMQDNSTGSFNTANGAYALWYNTTGSDNTGTGAYALSAANVPLFVTGGGNTADGAYALAGNENGYNNTGVGFQALQNNTNGFDNVAMGVNALQVLNNGSLNFENTAIGTYSLPNLTNGYENLALGIYAGYYLSNGGGNIYLGNYGSATDNDVTRIGEFQSDTFISSWNGAFDNGVLALEQSDTNNGLVYQSSTGSPLDNVGNGPFLYGYDGGALGTVGPNEVSLAWDFSGNVWVSNTLAVHGGSAYNGNGPIDAYIGGDGSGSDVQIGSLNGNIANIGFWNRGNNTYMNIYCASITITGGSDLAEPFPISTTDQKVCEGAVVVIDEENPGHLKVSSQPYDTRVAGVVSGANGINPGIQMQQQGLLEGGKNVALTGRVYVQADAANGPIKPGDLLTTSDTPGHAMKVSDHARAQGAILGKAMTGLSEGKGMVLVLVTLQ
jgi:hypothetical protein